MRPRGVATSTIGSSQCMPREPLRTISTRACASRGRGRSRPRSRRRRRRRPRHRREHRCEALIARPPPAGASSCFSSSRATIRAIDHGRRGYGAQAEAIDRFERDAAIGSGRPEGNAEPRLGVRRQGLAARGLASLRPAELEDVPAGRRPPEIVIKCNDAVHLGAGDIERLGDQRLGRFVDIAKFLLQSVQDRQHRAFEIEAAPNSLESDIFIPGNRAARRGHRGCRSSHAVYRISCFANMYFTVITKGCRTKRNFAAGDFSQRSNDAAISIFHAFGALAQPA